MRWLFVEPPKKQISTRFLLFPTTLKRSDGKLETRWLEIAKIRQEFVASWGSSGWDDIEWVDNV